ncbi:mechanosensitive ion channel domain-containing protein [Halomonas denitrificans]|nr:mechanosensitive ion channel [Halomonas denitrificans]
MDAVIDYLSNLDTATLLGWAWKLVAALLIFFIGRIVAKLISGFLAKLMRKRGIDDMLANFLSVVLYAILLVAVIIAAISQLGIQTTPLIAVLGAAGLAVGLALQNSLGNLAAGVMLVLFRPFTKGDYVEAGGTSGTVTDVGLFQSVLNTPDNRKVIVPNGQITSDTITNYSAYDTRRIDLIIGVGYGDDLKVARSTIEKVLEAHEKVLDDPAPVIWVMELGDSSVNFAVRPWVKAADYWGVRSELLESLKVELEDAGCEIPFPQRDVHLHQVEAD